MAGWWSSSQATEAAQAFAFDTYTGFTDKHEAARKNDFPKIFGLSVRCVKDN
jgi:hypothetical protein